MRIFSFIFSLQISFHLNTQIDNKEKKAETEGNKLQGKNELGREKRWQDLRHAFH